MATDQSVLGLFQTPEQYQLAQTMAMQQQAQDQAAKFAQLNNRERANQSYYLAGSGLGNVLGRALGAEDPMLQRQAARRTLLQQVNIADPDALKQGIQAASSDPELQQYFFSKYKELTGIQKEQSTIAKNQAWEASKTDSEKKRNLLSDVEQSLSEGKSVEPARLNQARLAWAQETKPKTFQQPDGNIVTVPGVDVSLFPNIGKTLGMVGGGASVGGAPRAGVIVTPAGQEAAQTQAETAKEAVATVQNAINQVDAASKLYDTSKTAGGYGQLLAGLPMSDARSLANLTSNIKSAFSVEEIAKLKAQSKTGATGFGSLAVKELETIQNAVTALDPADKNYPTQLKTIRDSFDRWKKLMETRSVRAEAKASSMSGRNPQLQPSEGDAWLEKAMMQNPSYSRAQVIEQGIKAKKLPAGYQ